MFNPDGWLYTGDLAKMDEDGYFYIVDRKKDMIIVGGYNVYPREVEEVFYHHPDVLEAAVFGVPDPNRGEAVVAYVATKDPLLTVEQLHAYCKEHLAKYKLPAVIEIIKGLPKSGTGKILRRALKEQLVEEGIKILDLSRTLAGPFSTMLLGDMGADVIKVEQPGQGDESRRFTPPTWNNDESCYYLSSNRNKRSITVDLKSEEGKEIIYKLANDADVLVENFRTGTLEKLGYGYETMKNINPRLVYCSISGFGRTGPERNRAGYDLLLQGFGGLMSITGDANSGPAKAGMSIVDLTTGMFAAYGILSALFSVQKTGKGQFVDVSLLDGQVVLLNHLATGFLATGKPAGRMGSAHPSIVPYQSFRAKDMDIILAVANDRLWKKCCQAFDWIDLMEDARFETNAKRVDHRQELVTIISERLIAMESKDIFEKMDNTGVPCGPIHSIDQVLNHPQVRAREMMIEIEHPNIKNLKVPGFPVKLSETPSNVRRHPPLLGEHTDEALEELGYSKEQIQNLKSGNVI